MRHPSIIAMTIALMSAQGIAFAQWLYYPTPDVPRTTDGKPNLSAPPASETVCGSTWAVRR